MSFPTKIGMFDPTGAFFYISLETGGGMLDITPAAAPTPPPNPPVLVTAAITIKLKQTIEWTKRFMANRSSVIGNSLEPALTNANLILQTILGPPFRWRWNRTITGFMTVAGQQDYYIFNWTASTQVGQGWVTVDGFGNCQQVLVPGITQASVSPTWNNTVGGTTTDNTVTWINLGNLGSTVSTTYRFGWIEGAVVQDANGNYQEIPNKNWLSQDTKQDRPRFIAAQIDDGSGNIAFRVQPVPDGTYPVLITMQQKPTVFTGTNQLWSPVPDEYARLYEYGLLSLMLLFADDPRYQTINAKFVASVLAASEGLSETERNIWMNSWNSVVNSIQVEQFRTQQGGSARGQ